MDESSPPKPVGAYERMWRMAMYHSSNNNSNSQSELQDLYFEPRLCGFEAASTIGGRVAVPRKIFALIKEKWQSTNLYVCRSVSASKTPDGAIMKLGYLKAYPYNPFGKHKDPSYSICPLKTGAGGKGIVDVAGIDLTSIGHKPGGRLVWLGMGEFAELWGFDHWRAYWENFIKCECPDPAVQELERKFMVESLMTPCELEREVG